MSERRYGHHHSRRKKNRRGRLFTIGVLLLAALLVLCAYAGKIPSTTFFAAPFLNLAYLPVLMFAALVLLIALLMRRWLASILLVLAFLATTPVFSLNVPMNSEEDAPPVPVDPAMQLKVMTYNVLAFNYNESETSDSISMTMKLILDADPDVVLMQEGCPIGVSWDEIPSIKPLVGEIEAKYPYRYDGNEGLNIMSKYPFTTTPLGEPQYSRTILGFKRNLTAYLARAYDLQLPSGKQLRLIDFRLQSYHLSFGKSQNVRISPDVKLSPLERMRRSFALREDNAVQIRNSIDASPANVIVCGDMNDVPASRVYRLIRGEDMRDAWVELGRGYAPTFNRHHLPFRIDQVFYRGALQALQAQRIKGGSSDHYPLMVTFDMDINY